MTDRDFPGVPVVKTPCFHCRGPGVGSLAMELRSPHALGAWPNKKKVKKKLTDRI